MDTLLFISERRGLFRLIYRICTFHWMSLERNLPDMENWVSKIVDEEDVRKVLTTCNLLVITRVILDI